MSKPEMVRVEVAYAALQRQFLRAIELPVGATVIDALRASGVEAECAIRLADLRIGIWSKAVDPSTVVGEGDRIEIYRPLKIDPMDARRKRARNASR